MIHHKKSTPYYPIYNKLVDSSNKIMCNVLTKTYEVGRKYWAKKLHVMLWALKSTYNISVGQTPFQLVYSQQEILPIEFQVPSIQVSIQEKWNDKQYLKERKTKLNDFE